LSEFLDRAVTESTEHLVLIYKEGYSRDATGLVEALVDCGIPTVLIGGPEQSTTHADQIDGGNLFHLSAAAMMASSDDVLCVSTPRSCRRVLLLKSADLNTFRLINHAHAMNWATVYYPDRSKDQAGSDLEAQTYVIKNAEHVIVASESVKGEMEAIGARGVKVISEGKGSKDQVAQILELLVDPLTKSPVRFAIEGANCG